MNPFNTIPNFLKVFALLNKYNKAAPEIDRLRASGDLAGEQELIRKRTGEIIAEMSAKLHVDFIIEGVENVPESGPCLIMANHQGYADVLALYTAIRKFQFGFIAKDEFRRIKPLAKAIEYTRSHFLIRGDSKDALKTINDVADLMNQGFSFCIFPEGTRSRKNEPGEFKSAAIKFATKAGVPVLPVTIDGAYRMYETQNNFRPCTVRVIIHPLVHVEEMDRKAQKQAWTDIVDAITSPLLEKQEKQENREKQDKQEAPAAE